MAVDTQVTARALVAEILNGDLDSVAHSQQVHQLRFASRILPLRATPVTAVSAVEIDGEAVDVDAYTFTPFALVREDEEEWPTARILVTYTTGWADVDLPSEVTEAIEAIVARLDARPDSNVISEAADDIRVTYAESGNVTSNERSLLRKYTRP